MNVFLVPTAAINVTADCNSTRLSLSWQQPEGDLDALVVTLSTNGTSCWETTLPPDATEVVIDQLTPSSAYQVVVMSRSGKLTNQSETTIRTGDVLFCSFSFFSLFFSSIFIVLSLWRLQRRRQRPSSPCLPAPPLVDSSCPGRLLLATGRATRCSCLTAPSS